MDSQLKILTLLRKSGLTFEGLYAAISDHVVLHRDGLESLLKVMLKNRLVAVKDGVWSFNAWPAGYASSGAKKKPEKVAAGGLMHGW